MTSRLFSVMLIVALLSPVSVNWNPAGVVTSTETSTMTGNYTSTNSSISTLTTVGNVTESSVHTVFSRITATISADPCSYGEWGSFHANKTETLSVSFVSSEPVDVYLVTFEQFLDFMGGSSCVPGGALFFMNNVTSYGLNMKIPYSGDFILLFVNHSLKPVTLTLLTFELSEVTVHPGMVTFYSTNYQPLTGNTTQLVTGTFTTQQTELNKYGSIIVLAIILSGLALVGAVVYFLLKRKRATTGPDHLILEREQFAL